MNLAMGYLNTTFSYSWYSDSSESILPIQSFPKLKKSYEKKVLVQIYRVNVMNTGSVLSDDVVLGYVIPSNRSLQDPSPPLTTLFAFQRLRLDVNQTTQVYFPLTVQSLLTVGHDRTKWLEPGTYGIMVGKHRMHTLHLQGEPIKWSSIEI